MAPILDRDGQWTGAKGIRREGCKSCMVACHRRQHPGIPKADGKHLKEHEMRHAHCPREEKARNGQERSLLPSTAASAREWNAAADRCARTLPGGGGRRGFLSVERTSAERKLSLPVIVNWREHKLHTETSGGRNRNDSRAYFQGKFICKLFTQPNRSLRLLSGTTSIGTDSIHRIWQLLT